MGRLLLPDLITYMLQSAGDIDLASLREMAHIIDGGTEGMMRWKHMKGLPCNVEVIHAQGHVKADVGLR